jgi:hypothetical protein
LKKYQDEGLVSYDNFDIIQTEVDPSALKEGQLLLKSLVFSVDPYLRGGCKSTGGRAIGSKMDGFIAGKVLESKNKNWMKGDLFGAALPFATVQIVGEEQIASTMMWKLTEYLKESEISYGIGVLGMPGSTAYGGLIDVLRPNKGETIFISGSAGAVGSMVGQLAKKLYGCTVIGSCGGDKKCDFIKTAFGFDSAIDYKQVKTEAELRALVKQASPEGKGIDMYFENVGGIHFEAAYNSLKPYGRIAVCGGISEYNNAEFNKVSINPMQMVYTFQRIEGFVCHPYLTGKKLNFLKDMSKYLRDGTLVIEETVFNGIESWPDAFQSLFTGKNTGKVVVRV